MPTPNDNRTPGQLRAAELKAGAARADRRRRSIAIVSVLVVAALLVAFFVSLALKKKASNAEVLAFAAPTGAAIAPAVQNAGLKVLSKEHLEFHIHSHLQLSINGSDVVVPINIGVEPGVGLSPLHTHDTSGAVHVESEVKGDYTLGQFFKEWAVPLTTTCVGTKCADATHELKAWVNGAPFTGDPNTITLADHEDITVAYLDKGKSFTPEKFDFAAAQL